VGLKVGGEAEHRLAERGDAAHRPDPAPLPEVSDVHDAVVPREGQQCCAADRGPLQREGEDGAAVRLERRRALRPLARPDPDLLGRPSSSSEARPFHSESGLSVTECERIWQASASAPTETRSSGASSTDHRARHYDSILHSYYYYLVF
jgi:hypothetical protein